MKYRFRDSLLINPYVPQRKFGVGAIAGAIVGSSLINTIGAEDTNDAQISFAAAENETNRKFNAEEAEKQRQWQSEEWQRQFDQQSAQWFTQTDYANQQAFNYWMKQQNYNTPSEQVRRLNQAGLNPAVLGVGSSTYGSTGMSAAPVNVPNPSVPSAAAASAPSPLQPTLRNPLEGAASAIQSFASMYQAVQQGKFSGSQNDLLLAQFDSLIAGAAADTRAKELYAESLELSNKFSRLSMDDRLSQEFNKVLLLQAQTLLADEQGQTEYYKRWQLQNQALEHMAETRLKGAKREAVLFELKFQRAAFDDRLRSIQADNNLKNAQAFKARAEGLTENELRPLRRKIMESQELLADLQAQGVAWDNLLKDKTFNALVTKIIEDAKRSKLLTEQEAYKVGMAIREYRWQPVSQALNWISQGVSAYRDIGVGTSALRGVMSGSSDEEVPSMLYDSNTGVVFSAPWSTK